MNYANWHTHANFYSLSPSSFFLFFLFSSLVTRFLPMHSSFAVSGDSGKGITIKREKVTLVLRRFGDFKLKLSMQSFQKRPETNVFVMFKYVRWNFGSTTFWGNCKNVWPGFCQCSLHMSLCGAVCAFHISLWTLINEGVSQPTVGQMSYKWTHSNRYATFYKRVTEKIFWGGVSNHDYFSKF
jgi:hypothetical protein